MWNICIRVPLIHYPQYCIILSQLRFSNWTYVYFRKKSIRSKLTTQNPGTATVHNGWYWNTPKWNLISEAFSSKENQNYSEHYKNITFCITLFSFIVKPLRNKLIIWHISWVKEIPFSDAHVSGSTVMWQHHITYTWGGGGWVYLSQSLKERQLISWSIYSKEKWKSFLLTLSIWSLLRREYM